MKGIKAILYSVCTALLILALWFMLADLFGKHPDVVYALDQTAAEEEAVPALTGLLSCFDDMRSYYHDATVRKITSSVEDMLVGANIVNCGFTDRRTFERSAAKGEGLTFLALQEVHDNQMSYNDYMTLLQIVEAEATGGDEKSKLLIANVVLNRIKDERFPDSVYGVVYQYTDGYAQFSPIADGRIYRVSVSNSTISAVNRAIEGEDISEGALFFVARSSAKKENVKWFDENLTKLFEYGGHEFYKFSDEG